MPKKPRQSRKPAHRPTSVPAGEAKPKSGPGAGGDSNSSSSSGTGTSRGSSSLSSEGSSSSDSSDDDPEEEPSVVVPPTVVVQKEMEEIEQLQEDIHVDHRLKNAIAQDYHRGVIPGVASTSTFFAHQIGYFEIVVAPVSNARAAKCYHCGEQIDKGSVRLNMFFHKLRPSRWVHTFCATKKVEFRDQLSQFLSTVNEGPAEILAAVEVLRLQLSGSSSSSSGAQPAAH